MQRYERQANAVGQDAAERARWVRAQANIGWPHQAHVLSIVSKHGPKQEPPGEPIARQGVGGLEPTLKAAATPDPAAVAQTETTKPE